MIKRPRTLTPAYVAKKVREIKDVKPDYLLVRSMEDALYWEVLKAIANGTCSDPAACAQAALKTADRDLANNVHRQG
jgi:hypothetical protein